MLCSIEHLFLEHNVKDLPIPIFFIQIINKKIGSKVASLVTP